LGEYINHLYTAFRFSVWSLEALTYPPLAIVLILAATSLVWAGLKQRPFRKGHWKAHHWFVISHLLFFFAAIALAVLGANPTTNPTIPHAPNLAAKHWLDFVTFGSIAACVFWVWQMKGFRWFAASLMLVAEVVVWGALFIAGMSVSGDWL
jgi:hypothetical protein